DSRGHCEARPSGPGRAPRRLSSCLPRLAACRLPSSTGSLAPSAAVPAFSLPAPPAFAEAYSPQVFCTTRRPAGDVEVFAGHTRIARMHQRSDGLSEEHALDVALGEEVEDHDRQPVLHAQGYGRRVHHAQATLEHLDVLEPVEPNGVGVDLRIRVVDAV